MGRCIGITDSVKNGAGSGEKALEVRRVELQVVLKGKNLTDFSHTELPRISKYALRDRLDTK